MDKLLLLMPDRYRTVFLEFCKFAVIGGLSFLLDAALVYFGIYVIGFGRITAGLLSFPIVVSFTWVGNRFFTFRTADRSKPHEQWLRLFIVCTIGLVFNRGTYIWLINTVPLVYAHPIIGLMAGTAAAMFFNFFVSRKLVFRASKAADDGSSIEMP